jgi:rod shape-determining protein MreB
MFGKRIGIDLGTTTVLVYVEGRGIVLNEPSVVAVSKTDKSILAVGKEAKDMIGRTPDTIVAKRPLKDGVIADYRMTEAMLRYFINKALGNARLFKPEVMIAVPGGITSTERRAVVDAAVSAGAKAAYVIKQPVVAAIGANIPIGSPNGHMIVEIGGGTTEIAVLSLGGVVASTSVRVGGVKFDAAIADYIRRTYNVAIGERTAEDIKIRVGSAAYMEDKLYMDIKGRDMVNGLPKIMNVNSDDVTEAIKTHVEQIVAAIKEVLGVTPPELAADVMDKGIVLSGGTSQLRNLDKIILDATGVPTYVADDPQLCVARGTGLALENLDAYKKSVFNN